MYTTCDRILGMFGISWNGVCRSRDTAPGRRQNNVNCDNLDRLPIFFFFHVKRVKSEHTVIYFHVSFFSALNNLNNQCSGE